jgi:outer membrane protein assembly factor BamD (BamD/ComL family)
VRAPIARDPPAASAPIDPLSGQQALLDEARRSLARGAPASALASLSTHEARYPESALTQEREALVIKSLAAVGRIAEARTRAEDFARRYPGSLLLPSVQDALHPNP